MAVLHLCLVDPLEWVREQGVVLQSARGPVPNLAEFVTGRPIRGSWWADADSHKIFAVISAVVDSPDVVSTRLINDKLTLVHRRVWPALVRVADHYSADRLASVDEEHTDSGAHRKTETPFPEWVPADVMTAAAALDVDTALAMLPECLR